MSGESAGESLGECTSSVGTPGSELPSPFFAAIERIIERQL